MSSNNSNYRIQSFSALSSHALCGEQYRMKYIEGVPSFLSPRAAAGVAFHAAIEAYFKAILDTGEALAFDEIKKAVADKFAELEADSCLRPGTEADANNLIGEVETCLEKLHQDFLARVRPLAVEVELECRVGAVDMRGRIDLIGEIDGRTEIIDFKLKSRTPSAIDATQMVVYGHLARTFADVNPTFPRPERGRYVVCVAKRAGVDIVEFEVEIPDRLDGVAAEIEERARAIEAGVFPPAPADAWICSPDYCDYFGMCRFTQAGERKAIRR